MSDNPTPIKAIARTLKTFSGGEYIEGQDVQGSFKSPPFAFRAQTVTTGLVASTVHTIAGATLLGYDLNVLTTVANAGDAVMIPPLGVGQSVVIYNAGANAASVFPPSALVAIDGSGVGASVTLSAGKRCIFTAISASLIISAQLGATSA